jgi:hypothetical protein
MGHSPKSWSTSSRVQLEEPNCPRHESTVTPSWMLVLMFGKKVIVVQTNVNVSCFKCELISCFALTITMEGVPWVESGLTNVGLNLIISHVTHRTQLFTSHTTVWSPKDIFQAPSPTLHVTHNPCDLQDVNRLPRHRVTSDIFQIFWPWAPIPLVRVRSRMRPSSLSLWASAPWAQVHWSPQHTKALALTQHKRAW